MPSPSFSNLTSAIALDYFMDRLQTLQREQEKLVRRAVAPVYPQG